MNIYECIISHEVHPIVYRSITLIIQWGTFKYISLALISLVLTLIETTLLKSNISIDPAKTKLQKLMSLSIDHISNPKQLDEQTWSM